MAWQPQYIGRTENKKPRDVVKAVSDWNALWNTVIAQSNNNVDGVQELMQRMAANEQTVLDAVAGNFVPEIINDPAYFKSGVITSPAIADNAIITNHLQDESITIAKFAENVINQAFSVIKTPITIPTQVSYTPGETKTFTFTLSKACKLATIFINPDRVKQPCGIVLSFAGQSNITCITTSFRDLASYATDEQTLRFYETTTNIMPLRGGNTNSPGPDGLWVTRAHLEANGTTITISIKNTFSSDTYTNIPAVQGVVYAI